MSNAEIVTSIRTKLAEIDELLDGISIDDPAENPSWLPVIGTSTPDYHADYVNGHYWSGEERADIDAFLTATSFTGTTSLNGGLSLAAPRTNKLFPSNDLSGWLKSGVTVSTESGWQKINEGTANSSHECYKAVTASGLHTLSLKCKAGTASKFRLWLTAAAIGFYVDVDLSNGTIGSATNWGSASSLSASITDLGAGEYLVSVTGSCTPSGQAYYDIAIMNGANWQYTGTSRYLYVKECQFEQGSLSAYIPTTTAAVTIPTSQLTRTITAPAQVTKRLKIQIAPQNATDFEVFYHLDNNENNSNYADTELFREGTSLKVRTTHQNTVYRETALTVANNDIVTVAWTTSTSGLLVSFNGATAVSLSGDTFELGLIKERINGNITGARIGMGKILEDATWFVTATAAELEAL